MTDNTQKTPEEIEKAAAAAKAAEAAETAKAAEAAAKKADDKKSAKTYDVFCGLPNASNEINGIPFETVDGGVLAKGLTLDEAAQFRSIEGYEIR